MDRCGGPGPPRLMRAILAITCPPGRIGRRPVILAMAGRQPGWSGLEPTRSSIIKVMVGRCRVMENTSS